MKRGHDSRPFGPSTVWGALGAPALTILPPTVLAAPIGTSPPDGASLVARERVNLEGSSTLGATVQLLADASPLVSPAGVAAHPAWAGSG